MNNEKSRLIPIKLIEKKYKQGEIWLYQCMCGNRRKIKKYSVKIGITKSCGCLRKEITIKRFTKHGLRATDFYNVFNSIKQRCNNKNSTGFYKYGARDIKCLWKNFNEFKIDMYKSYLKHVKKYGQNKTQIDRTNNNGNYCKENCKWVTPSENAFNRKR